MAHRNRPCANPPTQADYISAGRAPPAGRSALPGEIGVGVVALFLEGTGLMLREPRVLQIDL